ncbi:MAG: ParB N-terminal domain-containing protein [Acidobacteriota bacterium]
MRECNGSAPDSRTFDRVCDRGRDGGNAAEVKVRQAAMPLGEIKPRPHGDSRPLNEPHVHELAESIVAVGLINPLTVDREGHLVAGAHRLAALQVLASRGDWRGPVPVTVRDTDSAGHGSLGVEIEVAENDKRRDYTREEIRQLAKRLADAGYRACGGRPRSGEKSIGSALETIVGKSGRQIRRLLADEPPAQPNRKGRGTPRAITRGDEVATRSDVGPARGTAIRELIAQVDRIGGIAERAAVLPLDEWEAVQDRVIAELAQSADAAAEALASVAQVARSAISLLGRSAAAPAGEDTEAAGFGSY